MSDFVIILQIVAVLLESWSIIVSVAHLVQCALSLKRFLSAGPGPKQKP